LYTPLDELQDYIRLEKTSSIMLLFWKKLKLSQYCINGTSFKNKIMFLVIIALKRSS